MVTKPEGEATETGEGGQVEQVAAGRMGCGIAWSARKLC